MIDAGTIGPEIRLDERDLLDLTPEQRDELERLVRRGRPGVETWRTDGFHLDGSRVEIRIRYTRPCITTLPARP